MKEEQLIDRHAEKSTNGHQQEVFSFDFRAFAHAENDPEKQCCTRRAKKYEYRWTQKIRHNAFREYVACPIQDIDQQQCDVCLGTFLFHLAKKFHRDFNTVER